MTINPYWYNRVHIIIVFVFEMGNWENASIIDTIDRWLSHWSNVTHVHMIRNRPWFEEADLKLNLNYAFSKTEQIILELGLTYLIFKAAQFCPKRKSRKHIILAFFKCNKIIALDEVKYALVY